MNPAFKQIKFLSGKDKLCAFRIVYSIYLSLTILFFLRPTYLRNGPLFLNPEYGLRNPGLDWFYNFLFKEGMWELNLTMLAMSLLFFLAGVTRNNRARLFLVLGTIVYAGLELLVANGLEYYNTSIALICLIFLCVDRRAFHSASNPTEITRKNLTIEAIGWLLPLAFLNAGTSKLMAGGIAWVKGDSLQAYFYLSHLTTQNWLAALLADSKAICFALGVATIAFELTWFLAMWNQRLLRIYLSLSIVFHLFIYFVFGINFFHVFSGTYLIYFFWRRESLWSQWIVQEDCGPRISNKGPHL